MIEFFFEIVEQVGISWEQTEAVFARHLPDLSPEDGKKKAASFRTRP